MSDGDDSSILEYTASQHSLKQCVGFNVNRGLAFHCQRRCQKEKVGTEKDEPEYPSARGMGTTMTNSNNAGMLAYRGFVKNENIAGREKSTRERN